MGGGVELLWDVALSYFEELLGGEALRCVEGMLLAVVIVVVDASVAAMPNGDDAFAFVVGFACSFVAVVALHDVVTSVALRDDSVYRLLVVGLPPPRT